MDEVVPDEAEEQLADEIDDPVPTHGYRMLPMVGLGGSAGAIPALRLFFEAMPADSGCAFVVIMHLSVEHDSALAELLQRSTTMPVQQVSGRVQPQANHVYVIPPRYTLRCGPGGRLELDDLQRDRYRHVVVDLFFRSLADTHGAHATAIVLSGIDGDGAIGIKRIKERGGLTIAQDPDEAEHGGMPRSALATSMVDWVLPVAEIPARVLAYHRSESQIQLPSETGPQPAAPAQPNDDADESALRDVLALLRTRTGHDFSYYKRATILRRIGRRMQVNMVESIADYLDVLRTRPGEAGALLQDLLITVTNFFRDADCFDALQSRVASLFHNRGPGDAVRAWVAACATGEEAYSVAMMLAEHARTLEAPPAIQVFATDPDDSAIRVAREALYPLSIAADVSETRLRNFFVREHRGYRVRRELREMVLFAAHDLLRDPPFSRLDLVTCRNLLIYLTREAQGRALDTFHFALQPQGVLMLGGSESVDDGSGLFGTLDEKRRVYVRRANPGRTMPLPATDGALARALEARQAALAGPVVVGATFVPPAMLGAAAGGVQPLTAGSWSELHLKLLELDAPPSLLVNADNEIVHLSQGAGRFLQLPGGEPSHSLLRAIHPDLRLELRAALSRAQQQASVVQAPPLSLHIDGQQRVVRMQVRPAGSAAPGLTLVVLACDDRTADAAPASAPALPPDPLSQQLDRELERVRAQLRDTVEQYETSTEELRASNEELQAMNEELRSATEELETSREELQSINEELTTVNMELKGNLDELAHSNSDMQNLMDATAIGTVFLDRQLHITRYTPAAAPLFNLIPGDIGRPLSDLTTQLDYGALGDDARRVLDRLVPVEREVGMADGRAFLAQLLPYRTLDDHIAGVVLTLVDVSERKRGQEALRSVEERFTSIVTQALAGVAQLTLDGEVTYANRHFCTLVGMAEPQLLGRPLQSVWHADDRQRLADGLAVLAQGGEPFRDVVRSVHPDGSVLWLLTSVSLLAAGDGKPVSALVVCTDVTEGKRTEQALRTSEERLRLIFENVVDHAIFTIDLERRVTSWNAGAERVLGYAEPEIMGQRFDLLFPDEARAAGAPKTEVQQALHDGRAADDREHVRKDGSRFWASGTLMPMTGPTGQVHGLVKVLRDQTETLTSHHALEASRAALQEADAAKDRFLAVLSHELRNPLAAIANAAHALQGGAVDPPGRQRAMSIVQRQSKVMKLLLDDLLDMSRIRAGRLVLRKGDVMLSDVVDSALEVAQPQIESRGHLLSVSLPPQPVLLHVDTLRTAQVLSNLLGNAARYTPSGGRIVLDARVADASIVFTITDNGIGMTADTVNSMFEMFFQQPGANAHTPSPGLGIGLALVKSLVELHGGGVHGESAGLDRGSRFTVTLPLPPQPAPADVAPPRPAAAAATVRRRVLVADDNVDITWSLASLLQQAGHVVQVASSGEQALRTAAQQLPDVAVLDIGMPDVNGYDVARNIRAMPGGDAVQLVAATGWGQQEDQRVAADAGFDVHLVKPVDVAQLLQLIERGRG